MKKTLLTIIAALLLGGVVNAQGWGETDSHAKSSNTPIVASVTLDGNAVTPTADYRLGAFVGEELRGLAAPHTDNNFWIQVFYHQGTTEEITFKLWDPTGEGTELTDYTLTYGDLTALTTSEEGYGTPSNPVVLDFTSMQALTVSLAAGWNWFSTNVDVSLENLQAALVNALGNSEITINSRSGDFSYYNGIRWRGSLSSLDITQMYQIETNAACEVTLNGARVNAAAHPITITPGFNWISFLCNEEMDITTAFSSLAIAGDMVVSGNGQSSTYNGTRWRGDLSVLEPGKGYLYESVSNENRSFYYPAINRVLDISKSVANRYETHWPEFNPNAYPSNLPVVAFVQIDGNYITSEDNSEAMEVAAFVDGECRGHKFMVDETSFGDPYPYVAVPIYYSVTDEPVSFNLYNHVTGMEYEDCVSNIEILTGHKHNELYLNYDDAVVLNFTTPATEPYTLDITGYGENAGGYYLIASPVTEPITPSAENGFLTSVYDLYYFDQNGDGEGNEWINYEPNTFTIQSKKGYLYASQTDTQLQFAGTACTDGSVPLVYSTTSPSEFMRGWNLIGNPLAEDAAISQACYVMNGGGTELEAAAAGKLIPAMNGVFVKATGEGQSVTFTPSNNSGEGAKIDINVLKDRGNTIDRAIVSLGEGGTLPKFMLNPENTKIYIEQGGDDYAVVSSNEDEIPVSFKAASNGTYTLNVAVQNAELDYLHLVDNLAGTDTDLLANPNYTFEANTGDYASRFTLVLRNTAGLVEHFAFFNGHNWTVSNQGEATLQVIDVTGRLVSTKTIDGTTQLDINAAPGVYMFRLVNGSDVKVQKVVVR